MGVSLGIWPTCIGLLGLLSALPARGRGDTFQAEDLRANDLAEASSAPDEILEINQELILPEAPERSFLLEGDIIKTSPFRLFSSANPRWPKKRGAVQIPFVISYKYDHSSVRTIRKALDDFARLTCIKFVPYSYQRDFISIVPLAGCFSSVGRIGGMQVVSLAPSCLRKGKGVALHELMHVLGFCHEHSRADRDKYISISWKDILAGFEMNFMKSWNANMLVDYDYSSVMHYSRNAFSMTGSPTITPLSGSHPLLGQRWNLSSSDITRINKLYRCSHAAAQPEVSTERAIKQRIMDFVPGETKPWSGASSMGPVAAGGACCTASASESPPTAGEASAPALPSSSAVARSQSAAQTRRIQPTGAEKPTQGLGSPAIPSKAEGSGRWVTSAAEVLPKARPREMEPKGGSAAQVASGPWTGQNPPGGPRTSPSHQEAHGTSKNPSLAEDSTEGGLRAASEEALASTFLTKGPARFWAEVVQEATLRPGKREAGVVLTVSQATYPARGTARATAVETGSSWATGSGTAGRESHSLGQREGTWLSRTEGRPEGLTHRPGGLSGNEPGSRASVQPPESPWTPRTRSSHAALPSGAPEKLLGASGAAGRAAGSKPSSLHGGLPTGGCLTGTAGSAASPSASARSKEGAADGPGRAMLPSLGAPGLVTGGPPGELHGWATPAAPSSPRAAARAPATAWAKEVAPAEDEDAHAGRPEQEAPLAHLARGSHRGGAWATRVPPGSASAPAAEPRGEAAGHPSARAEPPGHAFRRGDRGSLATGTSRAAPPPGEPSLPEAGGPRRGRPRHPASWPRSALAGGMGLSPVSPPADAAGDALSMVTEVASMPTPERQKVSVSRAASETRLPTDTSQPGASPTLRLLPTELLWGPEPLRAGHAVAGAQGRRSSARSRGTSIPGTKSAELQARSPAGVGTTAPLGPGGGQLASSPSGVRSSPAQPSTEGEASRGRQVELGPSGSEGPGAEAKEDRATLDGGALPGRATRTPVPLASGARSSGEGGATGPKKEPLQEESVGERAQTVPLKGTSGGSRAGGTAGATTAQLASSSLAPDLFLSKPTPRRPHSTLRRMPSAGAPGPRSPAEHSAVARLPPAEPGRGHVEGPARPAPGAEATARLPGGDGEGLSTKRGRSIPEEQAAGAGAQGLGPNGSSTAGAARKHARPPLPPLASTSSTTAPGEEPAAAQSPRGTGPRSTGPMSKRPSDVPQVPHPGKGPAEVAPSALGGQSSSGTEKVERTIPREVGLGGTGWVVTESPTEATVRPGTPRVPPRTLAADPSGMSLKHHMPQAAQAPGEAGAHGGMILAKVTPVRIERAEVLAPFPEPSGHISESHHRIGKRSPEEIVGTTASLVTAPPEGRRLGRELAGADMEQQDPSRWKRMGAFPKEQVLRTLVAASTGTTRHLPAPGCSRVPCGGPAVGCRKSPSPAENVAREPGKAVQTSTSKSSSPALLPRLPSAVEKAGSNPVVQGRARPLAFCAFGKSLCGREQSHRDRMLAKGRGTAASLEEATPCRATGGQ